MLGCAVGTVKSRTSRALARLRPLLEGEGPMTDHEPGWPCAASARGSPPSRSATSCRASLPRSLSPRRARAAPRCACCSSPRRSSSSWPAARSPRRAACARTSSPGCAARASSSARSTCPRPPSARRRCRRRRRGPAAPPVVAATLPELGLGAQVPARTAAARVGALPELPGLGAPAAVLLAEPAAGPVATLVWLPRPGLPAAPDVPAVGALLTVAPLRDDLDPFALAKLAPPGLDVGGRRARRRRRRRLHRRRAAPRRAPGPAGRPLPARRERAALASRHQVLRLESALGEDALAALARAAR